jgi:hypothetical protein
MLTVGDSSILLPLNTFDQALGGVGLSIAFVLDAQPGDVDTDNLKSAIERVVEKWRMLAGRIVFSDEARPLPSFPSPSKRVDELLLRQLKVYAVLAPLGPLADNYKSFAFSVASTPDQPSPFIDLPALTSEQGHFIPLPSISLIKAPTVPSTAAAYAKSQHPLTAWHVAVFRDATLVCLSLPHVCFDGHGVGLLVKALDAELHGREWVVPPMNAVNPLQKRLKEVKEMSSDEEFSKQMKETPPLMYVFAPPSLHNEVRRGARCHSAFFATSKLTLLSSQAWMDGLVATSKRCQGSRQRRLRVSLPQGGRWLRLRRKRTSRRSCQGDQGEGEGGDGRNGVCQRGRCTDQLVL